MVTYTNDILLSFSSIFLMNILMTLIEDIIKNK